jgi:hypothetical protein
MQKFNVICNYIWYVEGCHYSLISRDLDLNFLAPRDHLMHSLVDMQKGKILNVVQSYRWHVIVPLSSRYGAE